MAIECRCAQMTELQGEDAELYAAGHLVVDGEDLYTCPDTGKTWSYEEQNDQAVLTQLSPH